MKTKIIRFWSGLGITLLLLFLGYFAIRPVHLRWGATGEEVRRAMPGDLDGRRWTRAITVNATPQDIWPWLVQWGQGRGGWYSYDWLENLFGFDIHTADRILPEYQDLAIGDPICLARGVCFSNVTVLEPYRWLSWQTKDESGSPIWTFTFGLFPLDAAHTRLVIRESFHPNALPPVALAILEIPDVVMEQKALSTVKARAEGLRQPAIVTPLEIILWLAALIVGVIAGGLVVNRQDWKLPLALGLTSVVVLLGITFLFPPLWLRALLDLALLGGLGWVSSQTRRS